MGKTNQPYLNLLTIWETFKKKYFDRKFEQKPEKSRSFDKKNIFFRQKFVNRIVSSATLTEAEAEAEYSAEYSAEHSA